MINRQRLLERFLRYVTVDTTAVESADTYPSSPGQLELGRLLVQELRQLGVADAQQDEHGLVLGTLEPTVDEATAVVALNAHLDTSPETSGAGVRPQVVRDYAGGDLVLPGAGDQVIRVQDSPALQDVIGCTLITSDGTTLLGGDDKAGVAVIMETAAHLLEHPELPHGRVRLLFTCDEEIGHGTDYVDLEQLAADVCYTLDGEGANTVDVETFSADLATVSVRGANIHPSIAKDRMINAVRAAGSLLARLPRHTLAPESSEGREGFLHPYAVVGGVAEVTLKILLRDFETARLADHADLLRAEARAVEQEIPGCHVNVDVQSQYRNMADGLRTEPRAVAYVERAYQRLNRPLKQTIVRGGTDGSMLTAKGLPTPNLACGQHNPHSPQEWACLEEMEQAVEGLVALLDVWTERE